MKANNLTAAKSNLPSNVNLREEWTEIKDSEKNMYWYLQVSNIDIVVDGQREIERHVRRVCHDPRTIAQNPVLKERTQKGNYILLHDPFKIEEVPAPKNTTTRKTKTEE